MNRSKKDLISIIIPCFNEEEAIPFFYQEIDKIAKKMKEVEYEYIFINDGSTDNTINVLRDLSKKDKRVRYVSFSKNYGKEAGMYAGLKNAKGDFAAIMDVDLQDPPEKLIEMYKIITESDYDCVALYTNSHDGYNFIRKGLTNLWYKIYNKISSSEQKPGARDFRLMTRQMVDSILSLPEYNRYIKGIFGYIGFKTKWLSYDAPERAVGTSKFNLKKLIKYAIEGVVSFSTSPLLLAAYVGLFFCLISFLVIIIIISKTLIWGDPVSGWPSLACLIMFVGGIQLFFFGIMGIYLSKIYLEVKERPVYIVKETEESDKNEE